MKIVLVALNAKYVHSNLAVYDLEAYAKEKLDKEMMKCQDCVRDLEIIVREYTINHNIDFILQSVYQEKAEVVAFSCYIWNIHEVLSVARELSKVSPDTRIWLGGPEVSYNSKELLDENPFVEGIMQGEGEETFYELIKIWCNIYSRGWKDKEAVCLYKGTRGIIYHDNSGNILQNEPRSLISMDEVPFIYQDLSRFQNKILYYETSRGCPFSCSYCLSCVDKTVRFRSHFLVERELAFFLEHKVPQVKLIDRTFNCKKEHALFIWRYIAKHDNGVTNFHFEVAADLIDKEELDLFATMRPGLIQLEIGLQSTYPATIMEIRRTMNVDKVRHVMHAIHRLGNIHQHLDLIAGLPYEGFAAFQQSFNEAYEMQPDQLQLGFLKVLKGSYMYSKTLEYDLKYQEYQPYEVLSTKWISYDEILILKRVEEMVEVYHNSGQFTHVLPYVLCFFDTPFSFFEALGDYYDRHRLFGIGFKREARYEALREFCIKYIGKCEDAMMGNCLERWEENDDIYRKNGKISFRVLDYLLTYDYYLRENAKSRPAWARQEPIEKEVFRNFFKQCGTEEISLYRNGYDSRVAAHMMHIEPVCKEALPWILADAQPGKGITGQDLMRGDVCYCLFDYEMRNPLSKAAKVILLSHL